MKVYVISRGEYSDYRVIGIVSTLEAAQEYVEMQRQADYTEINDPVEFELDAISPNDFKLIEYWEATIFIRDGLIFKRNASCRGPGHNIENEGKTYKSIAYNKAPEDESLDQEEARIGKDLIEIYLCKTNPWVSEDLIHTKSYKSQEHAVKLAVEARQKFLRENTSYVATDLPRL